MAAQEERTGTQAEREGRKKGMGGERVGFLSQMPRCTAVGLGWGTFSVT